MGKPFISYFEHLAKLSQVANKQTMFLAHMLSEMYFDREDRQYKVDMSSATKIRIMQQVSPHIPEDKALANANQYLSKLRKAGLVKSYGRYGLWLVDPMCYGQQRIITKELRRQNSRVYQEYVFTADGFSSEARIEPEIQEESEIIKQQLEDNAANRPNPYLKS